VAERTEQEKTRKGSRAQGGSDGPALAANRPQGASSKSVRRRGARSESGEDKAAGGKGRRASGRTTAGERSAGKRGKGAQAAGKGAAGALKKGLKSRQLAVEILVQVESEGAYANLALANGFQRRRLSERDRAFVTALVQGVLRKRAMLDEKISQLSKQALAKLPPTLRNLLRLAIFQLEQMPDIPQSAVLNTANQVARATGHEGHVKFTNGLLRNYLRQRDRLIESPVLQLDAEQLATHHSMPLWLVERWLTNWGMEETRELLRHSQTIPELVIRTCETAITTDGLKQILESNEIKCRPGRLVGSCLIIEDRGRFKGPLQKLPGFEEGLFTVQDEAAAFVSRVVDPKPGELVVDLCAAPGGKSLHLAELMENQGRVIAVDSHGGRLNLLRKSRQRLGLTNIEIMVADGRSLTIDSLADRVLVDSPCTGTGVINRRSDLRFQRQPPDLPSLVEMQRQLLDHAATLVKPGGILVYSTCSIEPEENQENIRWFLERHRDFSAVTIRPYIPADLLAGWAPRGWPGDLDPEAGWIQLLPSRHGTSGFFLCRLQRFLSVI